MTWRRVLPIVGALVATVRRRPPRPTRRARAKAEHTPYLLFGGVDASPPDEFHDVAAGSYVACVALGRTAYFGCTPVVVLDGAGVREVTVRVAPVTPSPAGH